MLPSGVRERQLMGANSKIEWTHHTFNPVVGCTKISPACDHCYAESWARRTGHPELWNGRRRRTSASNWQQPVKWDRAAKAAGERHRVFCASLADVFDNQWEPEWRDDLWRLIAETPYLDWLLLTKRPQNIEKMLPQFWRDGWENVWLGTTTENQEEWDRRVPLLGAVPARVHFVSVEPMLGPIDAGNAFDDPPDNSPFQKIDWVICGGESGPGARPMHPDWARSLRDQCAAAGVPFHFKQFGEYRPLPEGATPTGPTFWTTLRDGGLYRRDEDVEDDHHPVIVERVGKKLAGRLLDGVEYNGFPTP